MVHVMLPTPVELSILYKREKQRPNLKLMPRLILRPIPGTTTADSDMDTDTDTDMDWDTTDTPDISATGATADTTDIPTRTDTDWDTTDTTANKNLVQRGTTTTYCPNRICHKLLNHPLHFEGIFSGGGAFIEL